MGPLHQIFSGKLLKNFGSTETSLAANFIQGREWRWPDGRKLNDEVRLLKQNTPLESVPLQDEKDSTVWLPSSTGTFTIKSALQSIRQTGPDVPWFKLVWDKGFVPRFSFILWMLCRRRLLTRDRMAKWGCLAGSSECALCHNANEFMGHLFLECI